MPKTQDPRFADPMSRAPAGYSLTQPKGKWDWDKPPRFANADEVLSFVLDQVEKPAATKRYLKLMVAGITIEEIVKSLAIGGFATGQFTVDVAELIKPPLATYFMGLATKNDIPVRVFSTPDGGPPPDDEIDDFQILDMMQQRNPKMYRQMIAKKNELDKQAYEEVVREMQVEEQSFLGVDKA